MSTRSAPQSTRRYFALSLLIAPLACLGCGGDTVVIAEKAGYKRRKIMEERKAQLESRRKPQRK